MAEETEVNADPSMEEILASIRRIISDDAPPAEQAAAPAAPEDVLELTQAIQDDGSVKDISVKEEPLPAAPLPEAAAAAAAPPPPPPPPAPPPIKQATIPSETLVSEDSAKTAAASLSSLANTVEIDRLASALPSTTYLGNGNRTLEDMAIELMRPLLKSWLDQNLPPIVERIVQKEVERISRRT